MKGLKEALRSVLPDTTSLGGGGHNIDRELLARVLGDLTTSLGRTLLIRAVLAVLIVAVLGALAWRFAGDPGTLLATVIGALLALIGAAFALRQVTDELARVRMLHAIAPDLSREALTEIARWIAMSV